MKKLLVFASFVMCAAMLRAQVGDVHFGIKGGANLASLKVENSDYNSKAGVYAGGLAHIHMGPHFAIQPELMYSSQGTKATIAGTTYKTNLNYVNLPVLFQYMTGSGFRLQTGPQVGFLASAKAKAGNSDNKTDIKDNYKGVDFSWSFGSSYLFDSGFGLDARYNLGLSNINQANSPTIKNRVWQFGTFYQFMHK